MIELRRLTKSYVTPKGRHFVFKDLNAILPENKSVALLGKNGAGKSTLLRIIGGIDYADSGQIISKKSISWPVALAGLLAGGFVLLLLVGYAYRFAHDADTRAELERAAQAAKAAEKRAQTAEQRARPGRQAEQDGRGHADHRRQLHRYS